MREEAIGALQLQFEDLEQTVNEIRDKIRQEYIATMPK